MEQQRTRRSIRIPLLLRLTAATLVAGLLPLLVLSISSIGQYRGASDKVEGQAVEILDEKALDELQTRTRQAANSIATFLDERVADTLSARQVPRTPEAYQELSQIGWGNMWFWGGKADAPEEATQTVPIYSEVAYIDASGRERIRIENGKPVSADALRDVSDPRNTTYKSEDYFARARALPGGEVYISYVTGWHISQQQQAASTFEPGQKMEGQRYPRYQAVVRFATPVFTPSGDFDGVVVLSLDHRLLMEQLLHINPASENPTVVYPDYASGNYAYLVDNQGYPIVHPVLGRIRGLDADGKLRQVAPANTKRDELQDYNWNLKQAGWADANIPKLFGEIEQQRSGFIVTLNQAGKQRASTYTPVMLTRGVYGDGSSRMFAGLIIGADVEEFHKSADQVRGVLDTQRKELQRNTLLISLAAAAFLIIVAGGGALSITHPLRRLTESARVMEAGELDTDTLKSLIDRRVHDEVTKLASVFKRMAEQVQLRERRLREEVKELRIEIDTQKKEREVKEIEDSDFFKNLQANAKSMRRRYQSIESEPESGTPAA